MSQKHNKNLHQFCGNFPRIWFSSKMNFLMENKFSAKYITKNLRNDAVSERLFYEILINQFNKMVYFECNEIVQKSFDY